MREAPGRPGASCYPRSQGHASIVVLDALIGVVELFAIPIGIIWWIPYLVHELGHFAGARVAGARFDYIPLGPFIAPRHIPNRPIVLRVVRRACDATLPSESAPSAQLAIATAVGPLANLLVGAALIVLAVGVTTPETLTQPALFAVGFFVFLHGVVHLVPATPYATPTDGRRLLDLLRGTGSWRRWCAIRVIARRSDDGIRPRDWSPQQLAELVTASEGRIDDVDAAITLHWHLLDVGRFDDAELCLRQAMAAAGQRSMTAQTAEVIRLEVAYLEARRGADPQVAVSNLLRSRFLARASLLRVVAAVQLRFNFFKEARATISQARSGLAGLRPGYAALETSLLDDLEREAVTAVETGALPTKQAPEAPDARPTTFDLDVSRFAVPDVRPVVKRPHGLRSARTLVGLIGAGVLALSVFAIVTEASRSAGLFFAIPVLIFSALTVVWVRTRRAVLGAPALRTSLTTAAVLAFASVVLAGNVMRLYSGPYLWIVGQARPCVLLDGSGFSSLVVYLLGAALGFVGLVMGTRAERGSAVPLEGIYLGGMVVVLFSLTFATDPSRLAVLIGCPPTR